MSFSEIHWSVQAPFPLLALLQLLPLLLALAILLLRQRPILFPLGLLASLLVFAVGWRLYLGFDPKLHAFQFAERLHVMGYHAAVDGVAVLFILLTAFLTPMILLYGRARGVTPVWRFSAATLAVEGTLMVQFTTMNLLWFTVASALQVVLIGHLIWIRATSLEIGASYTRFMQFMGVGLLLLLAGSTLLAWNHAQVMQGRFSFDLFELASVPIPIKYQSVLFFLLFYGLAVRIPIFPLHGWLLPTAEQGSVAIAPVFLLGLKTGVFGLLRFVFPLMPEAVEQWHSWVASFALGGVFYAAVLALLQENLRHLLAYAVVSHSGLLILGLFSLRHAAFAGSVLLSVNFGLAISGLLMCTGLVFKRTGTMQLARLGGLFDALPVIGITFFIAGLSIIGMPGTPGFDAFHLVLEAAIQQFGAVVTITAALGNVAAAGFLLRAFQRAFLAPPQEGSIPKIETGQLMERLVTVTIIAVLLVTGFHTGPWLALIEPSLDGLGAMYEH